MNRQIFVLQNPPKNPIVQEHPMAMIRGSWNRSIQNKIVLFVQQERQHQIQSPQNSPFQQSIPIAHQNFIGPLLTSQPAQPSQPYRPYQPYQPYQPYLGQPIGHQPHFRILNPTSQVQLL